MGSGCACRTYPSAKQPVKTAEVAAVTALLPRAFPWAERVEVTRSWSYEWWTPEVEVIQLLETTDNTPDEQDDSAAAATEGP